MLRESLPGPLTLEQSLVFGSEDGIDFQLDMSDEAECIFQHSAHPEIFDPRDFSHHIVEKEVTMSQQGFSPRQGSTQHRSNSVSANETEVAMSLSEGLTEDFSNEMNAEKSKKARKSILKTRQVFEEQMSSQELSSEQDDKDAHEARFNGNGTDDCCRSDTRGRSHYAIFPALE